MARTITIDSYDENSHNVEFTIDDDGNERSYKVNGLPVEELDGLLEAADNHDQSHQASVDSAKRPAAQEILDEIGNPQTPPQSRGGD